MIQSCLHNRQLKKFHRHFVVACFSVMLGNPDAPFVQLRPRRPLAKAPCLPLSHLTACQLLLFLTCIIVNL